jgi:predicted O-linked N-acetylglucosamine transferase (SPINDLY family)
MAVPPDEPDFEQSGPVRPEHAVSIVDLLPDRPDSVSSLSQLLAEHVELEQVLASEPVSPMARAIIGRLLEQQSAEREAFLSALRVYRDETARLTQDVSLARAELSQQIVAARAEREHLTAEFLDRVDQLSAKISTSAARYTAQLEEKEILMLDAMKRAEVYAGHAANAQEIIADMRRSSSWRLTAPIRLMSRMLSRRSATVTAESDDEPGRHVGHAF